MKSAGLVYGSDLHHLDHVAVVCILMDIPLIVTEKSLIDLATRYYPGLKVLYSDHLALGTMQQYYDVFFTALPAPLFNQIFPLEQEPPLSIWCPHGNSDKGHASSFIEGLSEEKITLIYGEKMAEFFSLKKVFPKFCVPIGNLRAQFYKQNAPFYDALIEKECTSKLNKSNKTLLYAPTWQDSENSSSFFAALPHLLQTLPDHWNLMIKPHPNLLIQSHKTLPLLIQASQKTNVLILETLPIIYPLLNAVDAYLGDMSSIGYDCLFFEKEMFFLNQNNRNASQDAGLYLFRCGHVIEKEAYKEIFLQIESSLSLKKMHLQKIRREVYVHVFGQERTWNEKREEIKKAYTSYLELN